MYLAIMNNRGVHAVSLTKFHEEICKKMPSSLIKSREGFRISSTPVTDVNTVGENDSAKSKSPFFFAREMKISSC